MKRLRPSHHPPPPAWPPALCSLLLLYHNLQEPAYINSSLVKFIMGGHFRWWNSSWEVMRGRLLGNSINWEADSVFSMGVPARGVFTLRSKPSEHITRGLCKLIQLLWPVTIAYIFKRKYIYRTIHVVPPLIMKVVKKKLFYCEI